MITTGYSDRINHALAFAAKHHDRQVRKGTRLPYVTQPANVAIILTRYDREESVIVAGILLNVVEDCVRERFTREMLEQRIASKFGDEVLDTILAVTQRDADDDGIELSNDERRDDLLRRLADASDESRWVCAAEQLHNACTLLADLNRTIDPNSVWGRFAAGPGATAAWYRRVVERLRQLGFAAPILDELDVASRALDEELARETAPPAR